MYIHLCIYIYIYIYIDTSSPNQAAQVRCATGPALRSATEATDAMLPSPASANASAALPACAVKSMAYLE